MVDLWVQILDATFVFWSHKKRCHANQFWEGELPNPPCMNETSDWKTHDDSIMDVTTTSSQIPLFKCTLKNLSINHLFAWIKNRNRSHPEMVRDMSRVTLNFDLSKIPFVHFTPKIKYVHLLVLIWEQLQTLTMTTTTPDTTVQPLGWHIANKQDATVVTWH